jgi:nitroreductase
VRHDKANFTNVDVSIVMDHLILAAADRGLGTCWIGAFNPKPAREILELPDEVEPIVMTPVGHPTTSPTKKKRKPLSELVRYERW